MTHPMPKTFNTLDGLRGIAAFTVLFRHIQPGFLTAVPFASSYLAVDLFFVLSGFVLAHAYEERLLTQMSAVEFMARRLIRLYPLFLLAAALAFVDLFIRISLHQQGISELLPYTANLLFVPLYVNTFPHEHIFVLNFPSWSIACELLSNLLFAFLIFKLQNIRWLFGVMAIGFCCVVATSVAYGHLDTGIHWDDAIGGLARVLFSFFAGLAIYRLRQRTPFALPRYVSYLCLVVLLLTLYPDGLSGMARQAYDLGVVVLVFPALVLVGSWAEPDSVGRPFFHYAGVASYGVYILQVPIRDLTQRGLSALHIGPSWPLAIGFITALIVFSLIADFAYDLPIRNWLVSKLKKRTPAAKASSVPKHVKGM